MELNLTFFNKKDILIILVLLFTCLFIFILCLPKSEVSSAEIYCEGKMVKSILLNSAKDYTFSIEEIPDVEFCVKNHAIQITRSDCFDKTCVRTGAINKYPETIVCLPRRITIKLTREKQNDIDVIV